MSVTPADRPRSASRQPWSKSATPQDPNELRLRHRRQRARMHAHLVARRQMRRRLTRSGRTSTHRWTLFLLMAPLLLISGFLGASGIGAGALAYGYYQTQTPALASLPYARMFETTHIFDRTGHPLYSVYAQGRRTVVPYARFSPHLIDATVAAEDGTFWSNYGVDPKAVLRAVTQDRSGRIVSGASGITQQLIKLGLLNNNQQIQRKVQEAVLSVAATNLYSKQQIMEMYLNRIYYGHEAYGAEAAAETYFGIPASQLDIAQAALLAGLPDEPSVNDPYYAGGDILHSQPYLRLVYVVDQMFKDHFVTAAQQAQAKTEGYNLIKKIEAGLSNVNGEMLAPHFTNFVLQELDQMFGSTVVQNDGLQVTTTLDLNLNNQVQSIVQQQIANVGAYHNMSDAAVVVIQPQTGEILSMIGSTDYNNDSIDGKYNAALGLRQPGSSIKPFIYSAAFEKGWYPGMMLTDEPTAFPNGTLPPYKPTNYGGTFRGRVSIRSALAMSLNIPAVKTLDFVGLPTAISVVQAFGLKTLNDPQRYGLSLVLGGGEVTLLDETAGYAVFANGGVRVPPVGILKVTDAYGRTLYQYTPPTGTRVIPPQVAYEITNILSDDNARAPEFGAHSVLWLPDRQAAVKTGTTNDFRDNWTMGYTPNMVVGVWTGNANDTPMINVIGISGAGPIWNQAMEAACQDENEPATPFITPPGIVSAYINPSTGLPTPYNSGVSDIFVQGFVPQAVP